MKKNKETDRIYCANCKRVTAHDILCHEMKTYTPNNTPEMEIDFAHGEWEILRCRGCDEVSFKETWGTSEDLYPSVKLYPDRGKNIFPTKTYRNVPRRLRRIYREVIKCYNNEISTLCAAGLRALIEGICKDKKIKAGPVEITKRCGKKEVKRRSNLEGKIEGMVEKNHLTRKHGDILHDIRFLGNESLHDLEEPFNDELKLAIEIVEHTLENLYEIPGKGEELHS